MDNWKNAKSYRNWEEVKIAEKVERMIEASNLSENEITNAKNKAFYNTKRCVYAGFYEYWEKYTDKYSHEQIFTAVFNYYLTIEINNKIEEKNNGNDR